MIMRRMRNRSKYSCKYRRNANAALTRAG